MTKEVVIIAMKVVRLIIKVVIWRCSMILRNRLKERRAALDVNQQEMGRLCGVSRQTISLIERGDYSPSVTLALTIAKVCGVTVEEVLVPYYRKAKKQLSQWDGEDEEVSDGVEEKLSIIQWVSSGALIISYFLIAASYSGGTAMFESVNNMIGLTVSIAAFLGIMAEVVIIQQKSVDCVKIMNPEKTASV